MNDYAFPRIHASASEWAAALDSSALGDHAVRFGELEAQAAAKHPSLLRRMGDDGRRVDNMRGKRAGYRPSMLSNIGMFLGTVLIMFMPVIGFAFVFDSPLRSARVSPELGIPAAGLCMLATTVIQIVMLVTWFRTGRTTDERPALFGWIALIFPPLTFVNLVDFASETGYGPIGVWVAACILATVSTVVMLVMAYACSTRRTKTQRDLDEIGALVAALPTDAAAGMLADRNAAITSLERRGLITSELAAEATAAPFGTLHRLDPDRKDPEPATDAQER